MPANEQLLLLFVAELSQRLCHSSVRSYLSAVRHLHIAKGFGDPLKGSLRLELALKGLQKFKPSMKDTRLPITPFTLRIIKGVLDKDPLSYENILLWAMCCLGFFAFLRSGEITVSQGQFDPSWHLTPRDLAVDDHQHPTILKVHLKSSKTDQSRSGLDLYVGRTYNDLCPVAAMLAYLSVRGIDNGPLFQLQHKQPMSRQSFVQRLKSVLQQAGVDSTRYSGHSFRIGAATTAAANGIGDATIQSLGRWASDSYTRYIRIPQQELAQFSRTMAA